MSDDYHGCEAVRAVAETSDGISLRDKNRFYEIQKLLGKRDQVRNVILIAAGPYQFLGHFESKAPKTSALFRSLLPYHQKLIHVRWSGEGLWIPLGEIYFEVSYENHTSHPSAGQILLYPGKISETEFLFCYGGVSFASKMGPLAANHFLTVKEGNENLRELGELVLWKGAQDVVFEVADEDK
ncbi:conserved hypothetical protein [Talaromyces stipitatus ATCC 10500]|uniref:Uncharacterized protein n=1 Tax=Talaromyces stipitatus (strain ATCC 10500 / CBS 375.48 / QM 6759 / NRRL 1006) TaxID=441959 RepID=B8LWZ3_TALSN|nr:uncharacterized protein TSTA_079810 [Talaromyces stipitatus ATCC 10500]EED24626.1 conserved hypothetical protein [Talaromyces stipitatus ATCC 10500]